MFYHNNIETKNVSYLNPENNYFLTEKEKQPIYPFTWVNQAHLLTYILRFKSWMKKQEGIIESQMAGPSGKVKDEGVLEFQGQEFFSQFLQRVGLLLFFCPFCRGLSAASHNIACLSPQLI